MRCRLFFDGFSERIGCWSDSLSQSLLETVTSDWRVGDNSKGWLRTRQKNNVRKQSRQGISFWSAKKSKTFTSIWRRSKRLTDCYASSGRGIVLRVETYLTRHRVSRVCYFSETMREVLTYFGFSPSCTSKTNIWFVALDYTTPYIPEGINSSLRYNVRDTQNKKWQKKKSRNLELVLPITPAVQSNNSVNTMNSLLDLPKSDEEQCNFPSSSSPRILLIEKDNGCRWAGSKVGGLHEEVDDLFTGESDVNRVAMGKNDKRVKVVILTSILPLRKLSDLSVFKLYLYTCTMTLISPLAGGPTEKLGVFKRTDWIGQVKKQQCAARERNSLVD